MLPNMIKYQPVWQKRLEIRKGLEKTLLPITHSRSQTHSPRSERASMFLVTFLGVVAEEIWLMVFLGASSLFLALGY